MTNENRPSVNRVDGNNDESAPSEERSLLTHGPDGADPEIYEVLDKIDDPEDREFVERFLIRSESSSGPFPPSGFIEGYERASKGLGAEVLRSAIRRVDATTNQMVMDGASRRKIEERGQILAALVAVLFFCGCVYLVLEGHNIGAWLAGFLIIAIVVAFIASSKIEKVAHLLLNRKVDPPSKDD